MNYLSRRDFNFIDVINIGICSHLWVRGEYLIYALALFTGIVISAVAESKWGKT